MFLYKEKSITLQNFRDKKYFGSSVFSQSLSKLLCVDINYAVHLTSYSECGLCRYGHLNSFRSSTSFLTISISCLIGSSMVRMYITLRMVRTNWILLSQDHKFLLSNHYFVKSVDVWWIKDIGISNIILRLLVKLIRNQMQLTWNWE